MKSFTTLLSLGLAGMTHCLDMAFYSEGPGIDVGFEAYLKECVSISSSM